MTAGAITESRAASGIGGIQVGSFILGQRLEDGAAKRTGMVFASATGAVQTPFEGRHAVVGCARIPQADPTQMSAIQARCERLQRVRYPNLVPVLESGVAGGIAFVTEVRPAGASLAKTLENGTTLPAVTVCRLVGDIAGALAVSQAEQIPYGLLSPGTIWLLPDGGAVLGAFAPHFAGDDVAATAARAEQSALSRIAAQALTGTSSTTAESLYALPGVPAAVKQVLARAVSGNPFPTLIEFARAFEEAIRAAGDDLIAGVWEALSRKDQAMAAIMFEMARSFAPGHRDLPMLEMRFQAGTANGPTSVPVPAPFELPSSEPMPIAPPLADDDAVAALLRVPIFTPPPKPKNNPWIIFAAGICACLLLLVIAAALTISFS